MEDAVRPRIASPGWLVRRAAGARARCCGGADATDSTVDSTGGGKTAGLAWVKSARPAAVGRADQLSNRPSFYLTSLAFVANLF